MANDLEARVVELELRSMSQQDTIQQLSDTVYAQQRQLDRLQEQFDRLSRKVAAIPATNDAPADEKPPHY